jgi:anaerobic magnesium-protoporphyrin IX monomethyl ester cyclase
MKFNFVFPNIYTPISFSPAIQILSAVLKEQGHQVCLTHIHKEKIPDDDGAIIDDIRKNKPDIIGFTSTSFEYKRCNQIAGALKKEFNIPVILGGIHATISPEDFTSSNFDAFVIGEAENLIVDIANKRVQPKGILSGGIIKNIDALPFNDWDIMDSKRIIESKGNWLDIGFSRGCPFNCAFCANNLLRKIKGEPYVRKRDINKCIEELHYVTSKFDIKVINFSDDEFTLNHKWLFHFLDIYKKEFFDAKGIQFVVESRVDTFTEPIAKKLKECGCREVQFGVETGSEKILKFLNKGVTKEQVEKAFNLARKYGMKTYAYMMIGIPKETEKDLQDTMKFLSVIRPDLIRPTFLCPVKGTDVYNYCVRNHLIKKGVTVWNYESPLKLNTINEETLLKYWFLFPWLINKYMGYPEYEEKIETYFKKNFNHSKTFDTILDDDEELDTKMKQEGKPHYVYKSERVKGDSTFRFNRLELVK